MEKSLKNLLKWLLFNNFALAILIGFFLAFKNSFSGFSTVGNDIYGILQQSTFKES